MYISSNFFVRVVIKLLNKIIQKQVKWQGNYSIRFFLRNVIQRILC